MRYLLTALALTAPFFVAQASVAESLDAGQREILSAEAGAMAIYEDARLEIAKAKASGAPRLHLSTLKWPKFKNLLVIPHEISTLENLQVLYLTGTGVSDLAPLAGLTQLKGLYLTKTQVSDLAPLANLTQLDTLWLTETQVSDLTPLANLTQLEMLSLTKTQVSDLAPLANLTQLTMLDLTEIPASDFSTLEPLVQSGLMVIK
ncbi:hypothetical protein MNBD_ALPHA07-1330 [hydrothermal vent metagenome]|uniref:Leucine-rich repeat domain-containing protein n=1 Tax=hydrothermal vent metagenome TaxID=652676 RepID=A0A3B0SDE7_9ZZZZ